MILEHAEDGVVVVVDQHLGRCDGPSTESPHDATPLVGGVTFWREARWQSVSKARVSSHNIGAIDSCLAVLGRAQHVLRGNAMSADGSGDAREDLLGHLTSNRVEMLAATHLVRATTAGLRCHELLADADVGAARREYLSVHYALTALESLAARSPNEMSEETRCGIDQVRARARRLARLLRAFG
ncbi:MAG: hypothetical protein HOW73_04485 [Polyangiaceae bacterium]|nr:hypothetical protein [Polyangiaceae bacterium]